MITSEVGDLAFGKIRAAALLLADTKILELEQIAGELMTLASVVRIITTSVELENGHSNW